MTSTAANDLVGIGFGPANLALAVALAEHHEAGGRPLSARFLERKSRFGWHENTLIDDATMQVSFLKDLATLRNPASAFSFLVYLKDRGRLVDFVNHKTLFPTRVEYHDYLEWAADRFADRVEYATEVVDVRPVVQDGAVRWLDVVGRAGSAVVTRRTRHVVVAPGLVPKLPAGVTVSSRVWHSAELLNRTAELPVDRPLRFGVVGAGQSAAEVTAYLHRTYPKAEVHAVFSRYGYSPADDTPFANRVFDPGAVDRYFHAPASVKEKFFEYHANTNYSVVDIELIEDLYARVYRESVTGRRRLHIHHLSTVVDVDAGERGLFAAIRSLADGDIRTVELDHLIYATGYRPADPIDILGSSAELAKRDSQGRLRVERDYRVITGAHVLCGIYLQGDTEHTHGISSLLLSNVAGRADDILASVLRGTDPEGATE
ncbi:lysine N(6)-hydroxylase/L-ornithine N(5)-oxygenase family protein [Nocardia sp. NBC_01499]|uniref:lysine N(6)-hydroxylase/L-ornithine N(5)-oxygenase family protein n=1 Tax=Nocardia sp. NBC_01499 TaxID=2903597 RepID=UPI003868C2F7